MPHMQTPDGNLSSSRIPGRLLGPALGDQRQGSFSIDLWRGAFQDAFHRLCPVRSGGQECGCLPVLAVMVHSLIKYFLMLSTRPVLIDCSAPSLFALSNLGYIILTTVSFLRL